jgi:hypothetical protein
MLTLRAVRVEARTLETNRATLREGANGVQARSVGHHLSRKACTPNTLEPKNHPPSCGLPDLSTRRETVRQPFSRPSSWLPRAVVIGLALTVVPTGTEHHRRVP